MMSLASLSKLRNTSLKLVAFVYVWMNIHCSRRSVNLDMGSTSRAVFFLPVWKSLTQLLKTLTPCCKSPGWRRHVGLQGIEPRWPEEKHQHGGIKDRQRRGGPSALLPAWHKIMVGWKISSRLLPVEKTTFYLTKWVKCICDNLGYFLFHFCSFLQWKVLDMVQWVRFVSIHYDWGGQDQHSDDIHIVEIYIYIYKSEDHQSQ